MRRVLVLGVVVLLWAAAAAGVVAINAVTNHLWRAEVSYLLVAAMVAGVWAITGVLARRMPLGSISQSS